MDLYLSIQNLFFLKKKEKKRKKNCVSEACPTTCSSVNICNEIAALVGDHMGNPCGWICKKAKFLLQMILLTLESAACREAMDLDLMRDL